MRAAVPTHRAICRAIVVGEMVLTKDQMLLRQICFKVNKSVPNCKGKNKIKKKLIQTQFSVSVLRRHQTTCDNNLRRTEQFWIKILR